MCVLVIMPARKSVFGHLRTHTGTGACDSSTTPKRGGGEIVMGFGKHRAGALMIDRVAD